MKDKDYAKAFKLMTHRLRQATGDSKAVLCMQITYILTATVAYRLHNERNHRYFLHNDQRHSLNDGNGLHHKLFKQHHAPKCFSSSTMDGVSRDKFMQIWLKNAIGNDLCIEVCHHDYSTMHMILDKHETTESLCVEYDLNI